MRTELSHGCFRRWARAVRRRVKPAVGSRRGWGGLRDGWAHFRAYLLQFLSGAVQKHQLLRAKCPVTSHFCASLMDFLCDDAQKVLVLGAKYRFDCAPAERRRRDHAGPELADLKRAARRPVLAADLCHGAGTSWRG